MDFNIYVREVLFLMSGEEHDDYEILIDDLHLEETNTTKEATRSVKEAIQRTINESLRAEPQQTRTPSGLEIDVPDHWAEILLKDGSILLDYEKMGWKVIWYNIHSLGPATGDLIRSWLSFRDRNFVPKQ